MEMKGDSATTSSSSITTSNYPPITITSNSVNEDVTINEMLSSVLRYQRKVIIIIIMIMIMMVLHLIQHN